MFKLHLERPREYVGWCCTCFSNTLRPEECRLPRTMAHS